MNDLEIKVEQSIRVIVNLKTFISIDVFQRGYYQLKLRCYKKSITPIGSKRIDGSITNLFPSDESDLKEFLDFDSLKKPDPLSGSRSVNYSKCTIDHHLCTWKCVKSLTGVDSGSSVFLTRPFYILHVGEIVPIDSGVCFEMQSNFKLYESEYRQEDAIILDFEMFFHSERPPDPIEGVSIQRKMIKIESPSITPVIEPVYTQVLFEQIYYSSLDLSIQCLPVIKQISKRLSQINTDPVKDAWSLRSMIRSIPSIYSIEKVQQDSMEDIRQTANDLRSFIVCQIFMALNVKNFDKVWEIVSELFDSKPLIDQIQLLCVYRELYATIRISNDYQNQKKVILELCNTIESSIDSIIVKNPFEKNEEIKAARRAYRLAEMRMKNLYFNISIDEFQKRTATDYYNMIPNSTSPAAQVHPKPFLPNDVAVFELTNILRPRNIYSKSLLNSTTGPILFVCVHGLLGDSHDLRLFRNRFVNITLDLGIETENTHFLFSKANQGQTFDSLEIMGKRLALEIQNFIQEMNLKSPVINFVCHSLGGLIARLCLRDNSLNQHRTNFGYFITFSTPHLSLLLHNHAIIQVALSLYQKAYSAKVIDELYLRDQIDSRQCLLYKLACDTSLGAFRQIILCSSTLDSYIHYEGALATKLRKDTHDEKAVIYREILDNFENAIGQVNLKQFTCEFKTLGRRYQDGWIFSGDPLGREAHIKLVGSDVMDFIVKTLLELP